VDLTRLAYLPRLILQPSVASTVIFSSNFCTSPLPFYQNIFVAKSFHQLVLRKFFLKNATHIHLTAIALIIMMETQATTHCCIEPFRWESLRGWDFRPQLIVVSSLFGGNPFVDGILGHNLLLSRAFVHNLFFFHGGILAIRKPFSRTFFFFTMEFWLSESLSHELFSFSRWNSGYQKAFLTNFFSFSRWNSGYQKAFHELFPFSRWNSGNTQFGGRLFLYIYHKEYLHRIRLVKNLAS
jgi:hypothetical protein